VINQVTPSRTTTAFSWNTSANARLIEATQGPAWSVVGEHDGYCKSLGVRHVRRIRRVETGFFIDDQLVGNTRLLPVTLRFLCEPGVSIAPDGDNVVISGRRGVLCRIAPPRGFVADIMETVHSQRFGHLAPTSQIILAGELTNDIATTDIAVAGQAKTLAHIGSGEVAAARAQSDVREKAWH
jgi:uncharacterized heparinase superfamily protein